MKLGILLLVGGKSSRMNYQAKADLIYENQTFLERISKEFETYEYKYLSLNTSQKYSMDKYINIFDEYEDIGPMSGIVSCFHQSDMDMLFVCSCDMPFIKQEIVEKLINKIENYDGIFLQDEDHLYPTAGIYTRKMLAVMEEMIQNQNYRLYRCIKDCHCKIVHCSEINIDESMLKNINTLEEYKKL